MNHHPILKNMQEAKKQKLEKELSKCIYKIILDDKFIYDNSCKLCDGYNTKCETYIPKERFIPEKYLQRLRENGL